MTKTKKKNKQKKNTDKNNIENSEKAVNNQQNNKKKNIFFYILLPLLVAFLIFLFFVQNWLTKDVEEKINAEKNVQEISTENIDGENIDQKESDKNLFENYSSLTEEEFKKLREEDVDLQIIDIRTPSEISQGKISKDSLEGFDFYENDFRQKLDSLDKEKTYFIYCRSSNRTGQAKEIMKSLNFKNVYDLKGGINAWKSPLYVKPAPKDINTMEAKDLKGKVSFIGLTAKSCPYCAEDVPQYNSKIYQKFGDKINFYVNVIGGGSWKQDFPQGTNPNLVYKYLTGKECAYVPSWVVLDKNGSVVDSICRGAYTTENAVQAIQRTI